AGVESAKGQLAERRSEIARQQAQQVAGVQQQRRHEELIGAIEQSYRQPTPHGWGPDGPAPKPSPAETFVGRDRVDMQPEFATSMGEARATHARRATWTRQSGGMVPVVDEPEPITTPLEERDT
ncbi:MAG: hypothetical protein JO152_00315, partial [Mycobacteriaceae bacterium]|nr:hypothetical protein [Mycobacteriaceae bacterium]